MPELPEVEIVKRGLELLLKNESVIREVRQSDFSLRHNPQAKTLKKIVNQRIHSLQRRAKYILFELDDYYLLSHLGMTGSWRVGGQPQVHDHIWVQLHDGRELIYRDPRRFGLFDIIPKNKLATDPRLLSLGPDPLLTMPFPHQDLLQRLKRHHASIKAFIMDQKNLVGVGNIYASEALHRAGIHPLQLSHELSEKAWLSLYKQIVLVLEKAIAAGGSTIRDFRQAGGSQGYFQDQFLVYGREGELCHGCSKERIVSQPIVGRNTFWCKVCQPYSKIKGRNKVRVKSVKRPRKKTARANRT